MAGIVNKPKKTGDRLLLRPSEGAQWEAWAMGDGAQARLTGTCDTPAAAGASPQSVLALPLRQLFAVPLWLVTVDADPLLMREMIFLQLERRGLAAGRSAAEMVFDFRIIATVENKTLVLAVALPGTLPAHLCLDLRAYEPSARVLPLPRDAFTLWREDGRLVLAVTRGAELAYFQALGDGNFTPAVLQELQCVKLQLESASTIESARGITVWGDFPPAEIAGLGETLALPVATAPRPAPVLPREWMALVPAAVRHTQHTAQTRGRAVLIASVAAGLYLLFLLVLVIRVAWFSIEAGRIEAGLEAHQDEVAQIEATAARWNAMAPAIQPESYPVELLMRCYKLLPYEGVRFTFFSTSTGKILIQGEATDPKAAFKFADDLMHSKELARYQFVAPLPATLPNGAARFEIEGTQYGAPAH